MKAILHIGQQKTGSTILQNVLAKSRNRLRKNGILYPISFGPKKQKVLVSQDFNKVDSRQSILDDFEKELETHKYHTVIFSEENLFYAHQENKQVIAEFLNKSFSEVNIVVYLRAQWNHIASQYQQSVRNKLDLTLKEYIPHALNNTRLYNYTEVIKSWKNAFPNANLIIRSFDRLINQNIIDDFKAALDIRKINLNTNINPKFSNTSFDACSVELLRIFNKLENSNQDLEMSKPDKRKIRLYLKQKSRNKKLSLSYKDKLAVYTSCFEYNKKLCDKHIVEQNVSDSLLSIENEVKTNDGIYNEDVNFSELYTLYLDFIKKAYFKT